MDFNIQVKEIRRKLNLSQTEFSKTFNIPLRSIQNWEQGYRSPDTATKSYLKIISEDPEMVKYLLEK